MGRQVVTLPPAPSLWLSAVLLVLGSVVGCGSDTAAKPQGVGASLFQSTTYPVTAVLVGKDQKPVYLESLSIHACPTAEARKCFAIALTEYQHELGSIEDQITSTQKEIVVQQELKRTTEERLTEEYEALRPRSLPSTTTARNPLKGLSKARADKDSADEWMEQQRLEHCEPIKARIAALEQRHAQMSGQLSLLKESLTTRLFNSLPAPKKSWKTGKDGRVDIDVTNDAPWTVWSAASHEYSTGTVRERRGSVGSSAVGAQYTVTEIERDIRQERLVRWILEVPSDLDGNKALYLDLSTAFDERGVTVAAGGVDGPYFELNSRR